MPKTFFLLCFLILPCEALSDWQKLAKEGTQARLRGNFETAKIIEQRLLQDADTPIGHVFALNTIITNLTWDETETRFDEAIPFHTAAVLEWCEPRIDDSPMKATANHYCGQANFSLSVYHGLRGNYIRAGQYGSQSINYFEEALRVDPQLIDSKLYLGLAYFVADNLPPFIKIFSRFLWFIPTGNSAKSIPYLKEVIRAGDEFPDVARYIYATLMLVDEKTRPLAIEELKYLVNKYPHNSRFQLRLLSVLLLLQDYKTALAHADSYLAYKPINDDLYLTLIWKLRAYLGLGHITEAEELLSSIPANVYEKLPSWSRSWHMLSIAQLHDLRGERQSAVNGYNDVLGLANSDYVNNLIVEAAESGLIDPYGLE